MELIFILFFQSNESSDAKSTQWTKIWEKMLNVIPQGSMCKINANLETRVRLSFQTRLPDCHGNEQYE